MDWKRIMNKRQKKTDRKEAAEETAKKDIQQYFVRLIPEINLRLLLDMEPPSVDCEEMKGRNLRILPPATLWVEDITVLEYQAAPYGAGSKRPQFTRMWEQLLKNKKERR